MRIGRMLRGVMLVLGLLSLGWAVPLAVGAADPSPAPDPRHVVTRLGDQSSATATTATSSAKVQSFRFTARGEITVAGAPDQLMLSLNGEVALPDRLHATLTLKDSGSAASIPPIEVIVIGSQPYVHLTGELAPNGKDQWILIDNASGLTGMPGTRPSMIPNLPPISTQTQALGDETINGTVTTHTRLTIDATALLGGTAKNAKPSLLTVDLYTGKGDDFPRRLTINGNLSIDPSALAMAVGNVTIPSGQPAVDVTLTFTMDFTDLNATVTINPPASFVRLSELLKS